MAIPRTRPDNLPAILSYGFRPFFLAGGIYGGLTVLAWIPMLTGHLDTASLFSPVDWHVHEMLFGFLPAVVTGFLLTAIPNWTGRLPVQGYPLLALVVLWLVGRFAVYFSAEIGWIAAMVLDGAFLLSVAIAAGVEIVAGRNWRNLKVLAPVTVLFAALMHASWNAMIRFGADRGAVVLEDTKTGRAAWPLSRPALQLLEALPREAGSPFVFPATRGDGHYLGLNQVWPKVRAMAELEGVRLHDLRHSFASVGASGGVGLPVVGKLLGHKQASTTQRYSHIADDPLRAAADQVGGQIAARMKLKPLKAVGNE